MTRPSTQSRTWGQWFARYRPSPTLSLIIAGTLVSIFALIVAFTVPPIPAAGATPQTFNTSSVLSDLDAFATPESITLDNGMRVVVIPDHRAPVVTHMVWYGVGSADESKGRTGLAHFLEHLMFKGTDTIAPGEFSRTVMRNGGQLNAFTSYDYTGYYERIAVDRLPLVMEMEADRMVDLALTDEIVLPERDVVMEEMRSRLLNDPSAMLRAEMDAALYGDHPYGTPIIGEKADVEALDRAMALAFYERFYYPANAVLIVAGDVTMETVKPLAESYYGAIDIEAPAPKEPRPDFSAPQSSIEIVRKDERAAQSRWMRSYPAPSYASGDPELTAALDVLSYVLGGGETSRLYRALVVDQKIAAAAGAWYWGDRKDEGTMGLYAIPAGETSPNTIAAAIKAVVDDVVANGITEDELARTKTKLAADAVFARDQQFHLAYTYGTGLMTGQSLDDITTWPNRIAAVSLDDVKTAARTVLGPEAVSVTGILLPEKAS